MKPVIIIRIPPTGELKVMPSGFTGGKCIEATRELEEMLGSVVERTATAEAFMEPQEDVEIHENE